MNYHINADSGRIASFQHEADRDIALDALIEHWGDGNGLVAEDN